MKTFEIRVLKTSTHTYLIEADSLDKAKAIENFDPDLVGDEVGGKDFDDTVLSVREIT
jgi:hypothetical protein